MDCEETAQASYICKREANKPKIINERVEGKKDGGKPRQPVESVELTRLQKQRVMNHSIRARPRSFYSNKIQQRKWGPIRNSRHSRHDQTEMLHAINHFIFRKKEHPTQENVQSAQDEKHYQQTTISSARGVKKSRSKRLQILQNKKQVAISKMQSSADSSQKQQLKQRGKRRRPRQIVTIKPSNTFNQQQVDRIIDLFAVDGGNFPEIMKELAGDKKKIVVRNLIKAKCFGAVEEIMRRAEQSMRFTPLTPEQMYEVLREMTRTRSNNRLLSELDVAFRESFTKLLRLRHPQQSVSVLDEQQICRLLNRIIEFPRGSKNVLATPLTQEHARGSHQAQGAKQIIRKPIKSGGRLLSANSKLQNGVTLPPTEQLLLKSRVVEPEELLRKWARAEEVYLAELYSSSKNQMDLQSSICRSLDLRFGTSPKWVDFDRLNTKMSQMVKFALVKLMNLTFVPYSQKQRRQNKERCVLESGEKLKRQSSAVDYTYLKAKKEEFVSKSMFSYDCELFEKKEQLHHKHRIFKDVSLLERQIRGHEYNNGKIKRILLALLTQQFPSEWLVKQAVKEAKRFSEWAFNQDRRGRKGGVNGLPNNQITKKQMEEITIVGDVEQLDILKKEEQAVICLEDADSGMKVEANIKPQSKVEALFMSLNRTVTYNP